MTSLLRTPRTRTTLPRASDAGLDPVREALRAAARAEADVVRSRARVDVAAIQAAARHDADRIRASAVAQGQAVARSEAALRSARARRVAQEVVLAARNALRLELQRQVEASTLALRGDPRYPDLLTRLTSRSRAVLGATAVVTEGPDGGVVAEAGSRRLDLSLPALAASAFESMTPQVRSLWTP